VADNAHVSAVQGLLSYSDDQLLRYVGATDLDEPLRPAGILVALDPVPSEALEVDGLLPSNVPTPNELYKRGRARVDEYVEQHKTELQQLVCPRWNAAKTNDATVESAPILLDLVSQWAGGGNWSHVAAVTAVILRLELDQLCHGVI
jgi:hypothetical protein